ncbi:MAG: hypothetical protein ACW986_07895 [Promethearchaeota archaeon]|jgi:hypothetical protein
MYFRKLNNATLWEKIQKLRNLIRFENDFKQRTCWKCGKELNIYDFLSDNVELTPEYIMKLWQTPILEFHCCECFKNLKSDEIDAIEQELDTRNCLFCNSQIYLDKFSKYNNYLKIHELKQVWLDQNKPVFCNNLCQKQHYRNLKSKVLKRKKS